MVVPEFMRFYGYTLEQTLREYAQAFFSLANSMYRLKAQEVIETIISTNATDETVEQYKKQSKGLHGIVQEIKIAKALKK